MTDFWFYTGYITPYFIVEEQQGSKKLSPGKNLFFFQLNIDTQRANFFQ